NVEVDPSRGAPNIAKIGVSHLTRPVNDAAHDRDFQPRQMAGLFLDTTGRRLQVEQRSAAGGTGDELCANGPRPRSLENAVGQASASGRRAATEQLNAVSETITEQGAQRG